MAVLEEYSSQFSDIESSAYREVQSFQRENDEWLSGLKETLDDKVDGIAEAFSDEVDDDSLDRAYSVIADKLNDSSTWSIDDEEILEAYRSAGYEVNAVSEIASLGLDVVEDVSEGLESNYRAAAAGQGAATGAAGLGGALADLPALAVNAMRAVHEHAAYYGFDLEGDSQRHHAMLVVAVAASSGDDRQRAIDELMASAQTLHGLESDRAGSDATNDEVVEHIVGRLTRGTAVQALPMVGSIIGGSLDQAFLKRVCGASRNAYRHRWLLRAYAE